MKATVSRRHRLATIPAAAAMTPTAAAANSQSHRRSAATDPVFATIERHRQAAQALSAAHEPPDELLTQLSREEQAAFLAWLTTPPATIAGIVASLAYASKRPCVSDQDDRVYASCCDDGDDPIDILKAGEQFPRMIAIALRKIARQIVPMGTI